MAGAQSYLAAAQVMLDKAQNALAAATLPAQAVRAECLLDTIRANLDNPKLSDADFRAFIRNSLPAVPASQEKML